MQETRDGQVSARTRYTVLGVLIGVAVIAVAGVVAWRVDVSRRTPAAPSPGAARETTPPALPASRSVDFQKVVGRWVRTDSPYVIEIESAEDDGKLKAAYYNPGQINVSRAEVTEKDGALRVFVELRDVNYPGSNYSLTYDPANDLLEGVYFQAVLEQTFDVTFARMQQGR